MSHAAQITRIALVDVSEPLVEALQAAVARIGARVVAAVHGPDAARWAEAARPDLLIVGPTHDFEAQRARCRTLRARITAPVVVLTTDGPGGSRAFAGEPSVNATLLITVGIDAMVGQLPVVLGRWAAWRKPRVMGPLRVDRADPAVELFGVAVKVTRSTADALSTYADRRRKERRSGPLPRISRITGSLPRIGRRTSSPHPAAPPEPEPECAPTPIPTPPAARTLAHAS